MTDNVIDWPLRTKFLGTLLGYSTNLIEIRNSWAKVKAYRSATDRPVSWITFILSIILERKQKYNQKQ